MADEDQNIPKPLPLPNLGKEVSAGANPINTEVQRLIEENEKLKTFVSTIVIAVGIAFITIVVEMAYLVTDHYIAKEQAYVGLLEKTNEQQLAIQKLEYTHEQK